MVSYSVVTNDVICILTSFIIPSYQLSMLIWITWRVDNPLSVLGSFTWHTHQKANVLFDLYSPLLASWPDVLIIP